MKIHRLKQARKRLFIGKIKHAAIRPMVVGPETAKLLIELGIIKESDIKPFPTEK